MKVSSIAVITGAALNVILDPIFMFSWGLNMGVEGASLATTVSQCVTFVILVIFYVGGFSVIQLKPKYFKISAGLIWEVVSIGIPTAVIQICLAAAASLTNIAAKTPSGFRFDYCSVRRCPEAGFDWMLCDYGIYAGISAGSLLCLWRKKQGAVQTVGKV